MPRGEKSAYTEKQKRQAEHIEEGYERARRLGGRSRAPRLGDRETGKPAAARRAVADAASRKIMRHREKAASWAARQPPRDPQRHVPRRPRRQRPPASATRDHG